MVTLADGDRERSDDGEGDLLRPEDVLTDGEREIEPDMLPNAVKLGLPLLERDAKPEALAKAEIEEEFDGTKDAVRATVPLRVTVEDTDPHRAVAEVSAVVVSDVEGLPPTTVAEMEAVTLAEAVLQRDTMDTVGGAEARAVSDAAPLLLGAAETERVTDGDAVVLCVVDALRVKET